MTNPNTYIGLPPAEDPQIVGIRDQFQAMDNFTQVFAIRPGDRVLFLAAFVLFVFTFIFNSIAEFIRQRLREKYSSM